MTNFTWLTTLSLGLTLFFAGCPATKNLLTVTLDEEDGIPPIDGQTTVTLPANFQCGQGQINSDGAYTISSELLNNGNCLLHMEGSFEVVSQDLYSSVPELSGGTVDLVQTINLQVSTLVLDDGASDIDLNATFDSFTVSVLNEQILDLPTIATIPTTVSLGQPALDAVKAGMVNQQPVNVASVIDAEIKAAALANFPQTINVDFVAQPEIIIGVSPLVL
jgi:hypothetical protein